MIEQKLRKSPSAQGREQMRKIGATLLCLGLLCSLETLAQAREAGWVPMEKPQNIQVARPPASAGDLKTVPGDRKPAKPRAQKFAGTVYDGQPPVTEKELRAFVGLLPRFRSWTREHGEEAHPVVNKEGKPDFLYSDDAARWVEGRNFDARRFFCIMGRMAAAMVIVEEGNDFKGTRPRDMPSVSSGELELARKHLGALLTAGGPAQPIKLNK